MRTSISLTNRVRLIGASLRSFRGVGSGVSGGVNSVGGGVSSGVDSFSGGVGSGVDSFSGGVGSFVDSFSGSFGGSRSGGGFGRFIGRLAAERAERRASGDERQSDKLFHVFIPL